MNVAVYTSVGIEEIAAFGQVCGITEEICRI